MISTLIIFFGVVASIVVTIVLLPDATLPIAVTTGLSYVGGVIFFVNQFFPVDTVVEIIAAILTVETAIWLFKLFKFGYKKIPGIS